MQFADGFVKYETKGDVYHEAAFDAYVTGFVFLQLARNLPKSLIQQPSQQKRKKGESKQPAGPFPSVPFVSAALFFAFR